MPIPKKVISFLEKNGLPYEVVAHRTVYTAYDLAQTLKAKLQEIAKTLLVKVDREYFLVIVPAHYKLDVSKVKKLFRAKKVSIASEGEMKRKFKVKPGAMTAFGTVHTVGVVMDKALLKAQKVLFGAGSFTESVRMKVKDFIKLEGDNVQTAVIAKRDPKKK
ncbi:MAG: aminoacyl-tRNA deacylase [Patescibacteria group bacterium]